MKRSETVLVYGVTGLLLVILGIAVIFGNEPAAPGSAAKLEGTGELAGPEGVAPLGGTDGDILEWLNSESGAGEPAGREGEAAGNGTEQGEAVEGGEPAAGAEPEPVVIEPAPAPQIQPGVPLRSVHAVLGTSEVVDQYGAGRYRVVSVQRGDTFEGLVRKWCADDSYASLARALNEDVDVDGLRVGQKLWLPLVDDDVLIKAWVTRQDERRAAFTTSRPEPASTPPRETDRPRVSPAGATAGTREYEVRTGESLWKIAAREVGGNRAQAYIDRIVALNGISDPDRVRAGTKLVLPPK